MFLFGDHLILLFCQQVLFANIPEKNKKLARAAGRRNGKLKRKPD